MYRKLIQVIVIAGFLIPGIAGAVTDKDFLVETTENLLNLCTVSANDPLHREAIHMCEGYLVGAYDYHIAENSGPGGQPLVCLPKPEPSRNEAVAMYVAWVKAHPQYLKDSPVETEFRFLIEKWPCKRK
jgi:Rap1a immunity proteins